jgi:uncharacterized membrane protein YkvA (DUF1232 family)/SAM-dependent methyltransferase
MRWKRTIAVARATTTYLLRGACLMCLLARDRRVPWIARGIAAGSAGYVLFPSNLIPDYLPIIDFVDDIGVVWLGLCIARCLVPWHVLAEHQAAVDRRFPRATRRRARPVPPGRPGLARRRQAFGVDPARPHFYSLRQSRYDALAQEVSDWASAVAPREKLRLLIFGCGAGTELRHLAAKPGFDKLALCGANLDDRHIDRREAYETLFFGDLMKGYPEIGSNAYDVVVCEQVLEHLDRIEIAIATLGRVLKPGGKAIIGVPVFPPPLHLVRRHIVPRIDAVLTPRRSRGHRQVFSFHSFLKAMELHSGLRLLKVRGFRVISGGLLRGLENYRWWWRANRRLGEWVPALCIEVQAIMEKPLVRGSPVERRRGLVRRRPAPGANRARAAARSIRFGCAAQAWHRRSAHGR